MRLAPATICALAVCLAPAMADGPDWSADFETALQTAQEAGRPVMVDFWSNGCGWCDVLDREVLSSPEVTDLAAGFVAVKVNGRARDDLATRYMVAGYPTVVFLSPQGDVLERVSGYIPLEPFLEVMQGALDAWAALQRAEALAAEVGEDGGTPAQALEIARDYSTANGFRNAADWAARALMGGGDDALPEALLILGKALVSLDEPRQAIEPLARYVDDYPEHESIWAGKVNLGYAYVTTNRNDAGRPILEDVATGAPEDSRERASALRLLEWLDGQG